MGRLIPAVVRGDIKPRTASTLAYLAQTFIQAIQVAQKEYTYAFGSPEWATEIRNNVSGNFDRLKENNTPESEPQPSATPKPDLATPHDPNCSGGSSDPCSCSGGAPESGEQKENDESLESSETSAPSTPPKTCHPACPVPDGEQSEELALRRSRTGSALSSRRRYRAVPTELTTTSTPLEATLVKN
jgi:hypothetical protein